MKQLSLGGVLQAPAIALGCMRINSLEKSQANHLLNTALENGDLGANYFQHEPYLIDFNAQNNTHLVTAAYVHYEPLGVYPGKTASLEALPDGAKVGIPNDNTNGGRALLLLADLGLIELKDGLDLDYFRNAEGKLDFSEYDGIAPTPRIWNLCPWRPPTCPLSA